MFRVVTLAAMLVLGASPAQGRDVLTIGLNDNGSYPYIVGRGVDLFDPPGLSVDVLHAVGRQLDFDVRFVRLPGLRVLAELRGGNLDGALMFSHSPEREAFGAYPMRDGQPDPARRLATLSYNLYRPTGSPLDWTGERFVNLNGRIAANLNYSIVQDLREMGVIVVEVQTTADSFRMLQAHRIDGIADHEVVADSYIASAGITGVDKVSPPLREKHYYLMLSHQYVSARPLRAAAIWDAIAALRDPVIRSQSPRYLVAPAGKP